MYCDRIYAVKQGKIVAQGTPKEILSKELIKEIYEVDAEIFTGSDGLMHIYYHPYRPNGRRAPQ